MIPAPWLIRLSRRSTVHGAILLQIGCAAIWPATVEAQAEAGASPIWLSLGAGAGILGTSDQVDIGSGPAALGEIGMARGVHRLSIRASFLTEVLGGGAADFGLLYGRMGTDPRWSLAAGISAVEAADCTVLFGGGSCENDYTVGLPLAAEIALLTTDHFGLGIHAFGNVNTIASFAGAALVIQAGRLR